jgi:hypothetical protein
MSGMKNAVGNNYMDVTVTIESELSKFTRSSVQLLAFDSDRYPELVTQLNSINTLVINEVEYEYTASIGTISANMNVPGQAAPVVTAIPTIKISFNTAETSCMLPFVFEQLAKIGYGLDLHDQAKIRQELNVGTEHFYLQRASEIVKELKNKGDDLTTKEYQDLIKLVHERSADYNTSLAYKIAQMLRNKWLYNCALGFISLFSADPLFKNLINELAQRSALETSTLRVILKSAEKQGNVKIERLEASNNGTNAVLRFKILDPTQPPTAVPLDNLFDNEDAPVAQQAPTSPESPEVQRLVSLLKEINILDEAGTRRKTGVKVGKSDNHPIVPMLQFATLSENIYTLLDPVLMLLHKEGYVIAPKYAYQLRAWLGVMKNFEFLKGDYLKYAANVVSMLANNQVKDDVKSFEYHWLSRMSYELPVFMRAEFSYNVALMLKQQNMFQCALGLASLYANDTTVPAFPALITELQNIVNRQRAESVLVFAMTALSTRAPSLNELAAGNEANGAAPAAKKPASSPGLGKS